MESDEAAGNNLAQRTQEIVLMKNDTVAFSQLPQVNLNGTQIVLCWTYGWIIFGQGCEELPCLIITVLAWIWSTYSYTSKFLYTCSRMANVPLPEVSWYESSVSLVRYVIAQHTIGMHTTMWFSSWFMAKPQTKPCTEPVQFEISGPSKPHLKGSQSL